MSFQTGRVLSIDVQPCNEARQRVLAAGLESLWTFRQANDLEICCLAQSSSKLIRA